MRDSNHYTPAFQTLVRESVANAVFPVYEGSEGSSPEDASTPRVSKAHFSTWNPDGTQKPEFGEQQPIEDSEPLVHSALDAEELETPAPMNAVEVDAEAASDESSENAEASLWEERLEQQRAELEEEHRSQLAILRTALEETAFQLERQSQMDTVTLATRLAEHLVGREIQNDTDFLLNTVRKALSSAGNIPAATITVRAEDLEPLQAAMSQGDLEAFRHVNLTMEASTSIATGGCLIQFDGGIIDARVEAQLNALSESVREAVMAPRTTQEEETA